MHTKQFAKNIACFYTTSRDSVKYAVNFFYYVMITQGRRTGQGPRSLKLQYPLQIHSSWEG